MHQLDCSSTKNKHDISPAPNRAKRGPKKKKRSIKTSEARTQRTYWRGKTCPQQTPSQQPSTTHHSVPSSYQPYSPVPALHSSSRSSCRPSAALRGFRPAWCGSFSTCGKSTSRLSCRASCARVRPGTAAGRFDPLALRPG